MKRTLGLLLITVLTGCDASANDYSQRRDEWISKCHAKGGIVLKVTWKGELELDGKTVNAVCVKPDMFIDVGEAP